jgi:hypothetical protein
MLWTKDGLVIATKGLPALLAPVTPMYGAQRENDKL